VITPDDIKNLFVPISGQAASIESLVARLTNLATAVAGVLAFFYLLYAGILYITSGNSPDQAKKAQQAIINVIIGIVVIALSYVIVRVVSNFALRLIS